MPHLPKLKINKHNLNPAIILKEFYANGCMQKVPVKGFHCSKNLKSSSKV